MSGENKYPFIKSVPGMSFTGVLSLAVLLLVILNIYYFYIISDFRQAIDANYLTLARTIEAKYLELEVKIESLDKAVNALDKLILKF